MVMQLSKSEYMMFLKHPAWLWLKKHDKGKLPEPDANLQARFDAGHEFEQYAEKRFPDGITLGFNSFQEYSSLPERTKQSLDDDTKTIFQGRFEADNITCICDIVDRVEKNEFDLYEIKSSTKVKPEHYPDLAFQVVVLESSGLKVRNIAVIHVNNEYVKNGDIDASKISIIEDVASEVRNKIEETKQNIEAALEVIKLSNLPDPSPRYAKLGSLNEWMEIYKALGNKVDLYSIYNLIAPGIKRIGELEDLGIKLIKDIPDDFKLTIKQQIQVLSTKRNERIIKKKKVKSFLDALTYPLYFLDYETAMGTVPLYDGTSPYQQIPFQYSLHIIEKVGEKPRHLEYLHKNNEHPVPSLLKQLKNDIHSPGNILVWYKGFEMKRNEEMAQMFPEFNDFLEDVNDRIIDLMEPFANGWFADKDFFGSASIKRVLPVMVPELSYKDLGIQEGSSAQRLWTDTVVKDKGGIDKEKLFNNLIEYCKMDTFAMYAIWQKLNEII